MRFPRFSIAGLVFTTALFALNFGLFRLFALEVGFRERWAVFGLWMLPLLNLLLVVAFRLRKPERRTPRARGFAAGAWAAFPLFLTLYLWVPEACIDLLRPIAVPISEWTMQALTRILGASLVQTPAFEYGLSIGFEFGFPAVWFSLPILICGLIVGRRMEKSRMAPTAAII